MTTTESIESLLKNGVSQIVIGKPEDRPGMIFATTVHGMPTGSSGNQVVCNHQSVSDKVEDCLSHLAEQVEKAIALKVEPTIVTPKQRN